MRSFSFPSKTFLLGEYAVLDGNVDALLLAHPPLFEAAFTPGNPASPFHPASPAGRWLAGHPVSGKIEFRDPHRGSGGFGGSGAEFLAVWAAERAWPNSPEERERFAWQAWKDSRAFPGSGADILAQAYGINETRPLWLRLHLAKHEVEELSRAGTSGEISLFHTGRKLPTHENLSPPALPMEKLCSICERGVSAFRAGDFPAFAQTISAYGKALAGLGLVAPHTEKALNSLKGTAQVRAAKGCGAMGADVMLVAHEGANLEAWAQANSLAPIGTFRV